MQQRQVWAPERLVCRICSAAVRRPPTAAATASPYHSVTLASLSISTVCSSSSVRLLRAQPLYISHVAGGTIHGLDREGKVGMLLLATATPASPSRTHARVCTQCVQARMDERKLACARRVRSPETRALQ